MARNSTTGATRKDVTNRPPDAWPKDVATRPRGAGLEWAWARIIEAGVLEGYAPPHLQYLVDTTQGYLLVEEGKFDDGIEQLRKVFLNHPERILLETDARSKAPDAASVIRVEAAGRQRPASTEPQGKLVSTPVSARRFQKRVFWP